METGTRLIDPNNNITYGNITTKNERKEYLESIVTSGLQQQQQDSNENDNIEDGKNKNEQHTTTTSNIIEAFYNIAWPILESEGGWTMVRFVCFHINFCCLRVFM